MQAILIYKRDAESADDRHLALLELKKLSADEPRSVKPKEIRLILDSKKVPFIDEHSFAVVVDVTSETAARLMRRLAFWSFMLMKKSRNLAPEQIATGNAWASFENVLAFATQSQVLEWTAYAKDDPEMADALRTGHALEALAARGQPFVQGAANAPLTPISRRKNDYLTHGFHKYKAKFFPRLARSLINITCPEEGVVLDPYCGSGTTGVEASLMGMSALEFDLDPLSAFISQSKALLGHLDLAKFRAAVARLPSKPHKEHRGSLLRTEPYKLPQFLLKRNPKRLPPELVQEIEQEATLTKEWINACADMDTRALYELAFSHALATKISLRWMGTGDNRFALEVSHRSLYSIFVAQVRYMLRKLDTWAAIRDGKYISHYGRVDVGVSDCTALPLPPSCVDAIVTSPPYLPAASGRETYLRSRAASLVGLGLMTEESIHRCEHQIVGSILAVPTNADPLPSSVVDLVNWMLPQRERTAKAKPTAAYFEKLGRSLKEMRRVLKPGGCIALVVSKEHMFYELTTRKVLRRFDMVEAISELATDKRYGIELQVDHVVSLELPKMDFAARPGSRGTYSESILLLRKVATKKRRATPAKKQKRQRAVA